MAQYKDLADIYDYLVASVDYDSWVKYIFDLMTRHSNIKPGSYGVDLACGTGNTTIPLAQQGFKMTGIDLAKEMLVKAEAKSCNANINIDWLCQDMTLMELDRKYDFFVCYHDGINYLTSTKALRQLLQKVDNYLVTGGLFIFDLVQVEKLRDNSTDDITVVDDDDLTLIYNTQYNKEDVWSINLTAFVKQSNGYYHKFLETHEEKHHSKQDLMAALTGTSLKIEAIYKAYSLEPDDGSAYRVFVVLKKVKA